MSRSSRGGRDDPDSCCTNANACCALCNAGADLSAVLASMATVRHNGTVALDAVHSLSGAEGPQSSSRDPKVLSGWRGGETQQDAYMPKP